MNKENGIDKTGLDLRDLELVRTQVGYSVPLAKVVEVLRRNNGDIVNTIFEITEENEN